MTPMERREWIEKKTGQAVCDEEHPFLCEDEEGEIELRCGLPKGHDEKKEGHQDAREVVQNLGGVP